MRLVIVGSLLVVVVLVVCLIVFLLVVYVGRFLLGHICFRNIDQLLFPEFSLTGFVSLLFKQILVTKYSTIIFLP